MIFADFFYFYDLKQGISFPECAKTHVEINIHASPTAALNEIAGTKLNSLIIIIK